MKIKKFVAPNMPLALHQVRENFGQDAVILSSRRVPQRLPDGSRTANVEVTAGLHGPSTAAGWSPQATTDLPPSRMGGTLRSTDPETATGVRELLNRVSRAGINPASAAAQTQPATNRLPTGLDDHSTSVDRGHVPRQIDQAPGQPSISTDANPCIDATSDELIASQLRELKLAVTRLEERSAADFPLPAHLQRVADQLRETGVCERMVGSCLQGLCEKLDSDGMRSPGIVATTTAEIIAKSLPACRDIRISRKKCKIAAMVGTVGSGKTTAVAKIAAGFVAKLKRRRPKTDAVGVESRVVVISVDHRRVGAHSQMQAFSQLIGIPFEAAHDEDELRGIVDRHSTAELILIDTPGWGRGEESEVAAVRELLRVVDIDEVHVVIDALSSESHMQSVVDASDGLGFERRLLFSKIDCTDRLGVVLGLAEQSGLPTSYLSDSPSAPGGIKPGNLTEVARQITSSLLCENSALRGPDAVLAEMPEEHENHEVPLSFETVEKSSEV